MKRALLLMSDTGGGHRAAAEALRTGLYELYGRDALQVDLVDVFRSYSPIPFKYAPEIYPFWIKHHKASWGMSFQFANSRRRGRLVSEWVCRSLESGFKRLLREYPADVVVCVHSVITPPAMRALSQLEKRPPFITVVTDLASIHRFWYEPRAERCFVPTQLAYQRGLEIGLTPNQLRVTGLPVHPRFVRGLSDKQTARQMLGWDEHLPVVLLLGGGDGVGPLENIAQAVDASLLACRLVVIAGKNAALQRHLAAYNWRHPTHIYGYVEDMPRLMAAADVLVTKAGPATISEACIAGLPMILCDAIPGQESGNVQYVAESGAGVYAPKSQQVVMTLAQWLSNPTLLATFARNARALAHPDAALEIAEEVWKYAHYAPLPTERRRLLASWMPLRARRGET